jgi:hypothetical protein
MVSTMNILPIIAIKASVFSHRNFLRDIFAYSDETMQEMLLETKIKNAFGDSREELRAITSNSEIAAYLKQKWNYDRNEERKSRIPLIVIEDSDLLISKREDHNSLMAQLLNELDGISSSNGRKIIFTTNKMNLQHVDEALLRPGRCFDKIFFHNLSPAEAAAARIPELEEEIKLLLVPADPQDDRNAILEIRGGTGGDEAAIFAGDLFRMYSKYCESKGWRLEVSSANEGAAGGFKEIICSVTGEKVYGTLKYESGVHRVQRVPATETQGRVHTSAASVAVLPEAEPFDVEINEGEIKWDTFRSGGPRRSQAPLTG